MKKSVTLLALISGLTFLVPLLAQSQTASTAKVSANGQNFVSAAITERPEPKPPENYPGPKIKPTVVLRVVFRSWGEVTNIKLVKVLPKDTPKDLSKDLVKRCKEAAKQIKFIPATRDGEAVSMLMQLEYTFELDK